MIELYKKRGHFKMSRDFMGDLICEIIPHKIVFDGFLIHHVDQDFITNTATYHCYHEEFDEVEEGCVGFEYQLRLHCDEDGTFTRTITRKD